MKVQMSTDVKKEGVWFSFSILHVAIDVCHTHTDFRNVNLTRKQIIHRKRYGAKTDKIINERWIIHQNIEVLHTSYEHHLGKFKVKRIFWNNQHLFHGGGWLHQSVGAGNLLGFSEPLKKLVVVRSTPHPVTVTTRIITFLVGNPYKPSFATVTGWGVDPR